MKKYTTNKLLFFLFFFTILFSNAQNVTVSGSCFIGTQTFTLGGDPGVPTYNGKPAYYNANMNITYMGGPITSEAYLVFMPAAELGTPEDRWVILLDGQPFFYVISNAATAPTTNYIPFDSSAPGSDCGGTTVVAPPNQTPTDLTLSNSSINENFPANSTIGAFNTIDPDAGNTFTYSLVSGTGSIDNIFFTVTGGLLRLIPSPDFETKSFYSIRIRTTDQGGLFFEKQFIITIINLCDIGITSTQINVSCNGGTDGSATATGFGGTGPYTYLWSNAVTTATASNLTPGLYFVTVTDALFCQTTKSINITDPPVLVAAKGTVNNVSCNGGNNGTATVVPSGGTGSYSYSWAPSGGTNATASGLTKGDYTVTVTDSKNCTASQTFTISEPQPLSVSASKIDILCNGATTGQASVTVSGGNSPYTYSWAPSGGTAATATGLSAGTYTVTITDNTSCSITQPITISQPAALTATAAAQTNVNCRGEATGSATVAVTGGNGTYTYSWAPSGGTAATASGLSAGTYTVTVRDENSCQTTQSFSITQPSAVLSAITAATAVSCYGGSNGTASVNVSGGTSPYTYSWTSSNFTGATASGLAAGNYTVTITDNKGCTLVKNINVPTPPAFSASYTKTDVSCNGGTNGSATITATGGTAPYNYSWSPSGGNNLTASGLVAGNYNVTVTDANLCSYSVPVSITQPAILTATTAQTDVLCNGSSTGSASVSASGGTPGYTYLWSPSGSTAAIATGLTVGNHSCLITDAKGCSITKYFTINQPPVLTATTSQINATCVSAGQAAVTVSGGTFPYTYLWSPSGATTQIVTGLAAGNTSCIITDANGCTLTKNFVISTTNTLVASTSSTNLLCNGSNTGTASVVPSGAPGPYSYVWSPSGGSAATASGLTAGNYSVVITASNGCSIVKNFTITQPPAITVAASQTNISCFGGSNGSASVTVTGGTGSYTYLWAPSGGTGATAQGLSAGNYTVTIKDANLCQKIQNFTITAAPALIVSGTQTDVSCNGANNGSVTVNVAGGTGAYTYAWAPSGDTTNTATGLSPGTYTVTVKDANLCQTTKSFTITEPAILTTSAGLQTNVACKGGNDGTATVNVTGGTLPYTYNWSSGATTETATGLSAGAYTVTVTDAHNCTATQSFTVTEPPLLVATPGVQINVSCNGASNGSATVNVNGGTFPYTYAWSSGATTATATGLSAGNHTVTITDAKNCTTTQSFIITEPSILTATTGTQTNVSCKGGNNGLASVNVSGGTGSYTYTWAPFGGSSATATGLSAGTYTVTIKDGNSCETTHSFTITEPNALTVTSTSANVTCNGGTNGSATVNVTGGTGTYNYSWAPAGGTAATASGLIAGNYTVTITDTNGCTATENVLITEPSILTATVTQNNVTCPGKSDGSASLTVTGGTGSYTYAWLPSGGTNATATGLAAGDYSVTATDANGCQLTKLITITTTPDTTAPVPDVANLSEITNYCAVLSTQIPVPTATDNCGGTINVTTVSPLNYTTEGSYNIVWSFNDGNGNVSTQNQTVKVLTSPLKVITFNNAEYTFNGSPRTLQVANLPAGATVVYSTSPATGTSNGATNAGLYTITATVSPAATTPNCTPIVLTAQLTIKKAAQQITFGSLPAKVLGLNNNFNLEGTTTSGLPVRYTFSYTSPLPPANVTVNGLVNLLKSGELLITAHQDGDNNYLPAASISQLLVIKNNDVTVASITIGGKVYNNPAKELTYVMSCDENNPVIVFTNQTNATIMPAASFTIQTPKPGIYTQNVTITSEDGTTTANYSIKIEKPFGFYDIVHQKFDNILLVNNNPQTNGGYEFVSYQWFKNGVVIGTDQYYSAGIDAGSVLDRAAEYSVKMTTKEGKILQTCSTLITPKYSLQAKLYPNPIETGKVITVEADFPAEELTNMQISLYSVSGKLIKTVQSSTVKTEIQLPETTGSSMYLVVLETGKITKSFKVIVK
jgi:hypothetical protein